MEFVLKLAREFSRVDWKRMLSEISLSEYRDWIKHFEDNPFSDHLFDSHMAGLKALVISIVSGKEQEIAPHSLLTKPEDPSSDMTDDEKLMAIAQGISGGVRF